MSTEKVRAEIAVQKARLRLHRSPRITVEDLEAIESVFDRCDSMRERHVEIRAELLAARPLEEQP